MTWSADGRVALWHLNVDQSESAERRIRQLELETGTYIDEVGDLRVLDAEQWERIGPVDGHAGPA